MGNGKGAFFYFCAMAKDDQFKKVVSHAKEYGYIFGSSEIYDGLSAVYDYAQNGVELKKNILNLLKIILKHLIKVCLNELKIYSNKNVLQHGV